MDRVYFLAWRGEQNNNNANPTGKWMGSAGKATERYNERTLSKEKKSDAVSCNKMQSAKHNDACAVEILQWKHSKGYQ